MYIHKIRIQNFRIFGDTGTDFLFDNGINVVIGENNTGKSAVIDAIRIAFSCTLYKKDVFFNRSDFHVNASGERSTKAQIDVCLKEVPMNLIEICDPESVGCGEFHVVFTLEKTPSGYERVKCRAWGGKCEGNPLSSDTLESINVAYLGALRDAESEMKPSKNSKLARLLESVASVPGEKDTLVSKLHEANQEILRTDSLGKARHIINENLFDLEQSLLHQKVELGLVEPKFESIMASLCSWIVPRWYYISNTHPRYGSIIAFFDSPELKSMIHIQESGAFIDVDAVLEKDIEIEKETEEALAALKKHSFELNQNGLGYNNLIYISAVLGDMSLNKPGIYENLFLVEEPEAHLHPQLQELVLAFFSNKVEKYKNIQVIMTSHSPTLVSKIGIQHINLLYEKGHCVFCYPLKNSTLDNVEKDYLEKYLDVTKSQLFFAKGILFVEGISEALLMPEFAKIIQRPLDEYSVELVNINGVGFAPFAKMLKIPTQNTGFAKAAIITDDDRCADKEKDTYISKDLDYDDDLNGIGDKITRGAPSDRYSKIEELCSDGIVKCSGAVKTFEYELSLIPNNIPYIMDAICTVYPIVGEKLKNKVEKETDNNIKALMIWLFIRSRDSAKAQLAQALCRLLKMSAQDIAKEKNIQKPFVVPKYIQAAIYAVTMNCEEHPE